jgi:hypothetical protein
MWDGTTGDRVAHIRLPLANVGIRQAIPPMGLALLLTFNLETLKPCETLRNLAEL